ncbi:YihY/virulence factor BrkB family protein [Azospirillum sp. TSO22-1]|uniref:YihY/virulence factor BrkB family protein n=1 Tax=Azospirillum sp. TSO22-1 TaxID=716789 RepID=UPI000D656052|nr:YihY/virulence factor BrkB family protein [Azospirillum sp. TSO22-1]
MLGLSRRHHYMPRIEMGHDAHVRGRTADTPEQIPAKGWKDILWRVWEEQSEDNISMIAAGVAYYAILALFPAIAAAVSIYGLVADAGSIERQFDTLAGFLPGDALKVLKDQAHMVASQPSGGLSIGVVVGLLFTLWSASRGVNALIGALNIAYEEREKRGYVKLALLSVVLTLGGILFLIVTLAVVVVVPTILNLVPLGPVWEWAVSLARWPILAVAILAALAVLYRYAPSRNEPKWRWVTWGSVAAGGIWLLGSIGFSIYVSNFGNYNEAYGSVGAVVILLLWLNLTAYAILLGAELNAEMEHQTAKDTTDAPDKPMGQRGARMADTIGEKKTA